ncbi:MAG: hypothetical protein IPO30_12625 [Hyphomonadaceae bacterium]|nr:hypothetical protein [Hyphomonadaceae bacterium]MBP9234854.1 hypothetical protein [Hyphomonadaceae bacterium]
MIDETTKAANAPATHEPAKTPAKFLDSNDGRAVVLGKLRTDEEARLAAEIEKLRD